MCKEGSKNVSSPSVSPDQIIVVCHSCVTVQLFWKKAKQDVPALKSCFSYQFVPVLFDQVHSLSLVLNKTTSELAKASVAKLAAHLEVIGE